MMGSRFPSVILEPVVEIGLHVGLVAGADVGTEVLMPAGPVDPGRQVWRACERVNDLFGAGGQFGDLVVLGVGDP